MLIRKYRSEGHSDDKIIFELVNLGFNKTAVDLVMKHLHDNNRKLEELNAWVQEQLLKGNDKEEIKEKLMDADWKEEIIDLMLNLE